MICHSPDFFKRDALIHEWMNTNEAISRYTSKSSYINPQVSHAYLPMTTHVDLSKYNMKSVQHITPKDNIRSTLKHFKQISPIFCGFGRNCQLLFAQQGGVKPDLSIDNLLDSTQHRTQWWSGLPEGPFVHPNIWLFLWREGWLLAGTDQGLYSLHFS